MVGDHMGILCAVIFIFFFFNFLLFFINFTHTHKLPRLSTAFISFLSWLLLMLLQKGIYLFLLLKYYASSFIFVTEILCKFICYNKRIFCFSFFSLRALPLNPLYQFSCFYSFSSLISPSERCSPLLPRLKGSADRNVLISWPRLCDGGSLHAFFLDHWGSGSI